MSRETENVLLLLVGVSGVLIVVTGTYTRYVKPTLMPWLLAGAVLVIVLAVVAMVGDVRRGGTDQTGHAHRSPVLWLLTIPVVVLIFVTPPAIGAQAPTPPASATEAVRRPFSPLPPERAPVVSLPDVLIRLAQDSAGTLDDRLITVTGFVIRADGHLDLGRVVIICCAADASLARIHLGGPAAVEAARHPDDTWLRVEGRIAAGPTLEIVSATRIEAPANTYAS